MGEIYGRTCLYVLGSITLQIIRMVSTIEVITLVYYLWWWWEYDDDNDYNDDGDDVDDGKKQVG